MFKRISILLLAILITVSLAACGDEEDADASTNANEETGTQEKDETNEASDISFDTGEYVYEIKEVEQVKSESGDSDILTVEVTFTNNTDEPTSPWMAIGLKAEQETDTTVEMLDGANGLYPEDYKTDLVKMGDTDIKSGATVDAVIGYEIIYPGEPVKLTNFSMTDDDVLFEKVVETTK